ncbi:MAG: endolytic transglycosylase MltG [Pyrinomonadaceae bacterium]
MKFIIAAVLASVILILSLIGFGYWVYSSANTPTNHTYTEQYISIEKGESSSKIIADLANKGIIKSPLAARIYLRLFGDASKIKAGDYRFESPISTAQVFQKLDEGKERTIKLTIPEGWTRFEIAKRIAAKFGDEHGVSEASVLEMMNDTTLIRDFDPSAKNLEGYLYPTTYDFKPETPPKDVVNRMVQQFRMTWKPEWTLEASKRGKTGRQIVTIASLIENESKFDQERPVVASVIYNRLDQGMPLGIDATNVYIAKLLGKWDGVLNKSDIDVDHPYNTRKISGLPPGPISSASKSSIEAALNPANTDYLYYVLDVEKNDGSHNFYSSAAEFEKGKAKYQTWLKEQRENQAAK